MPSTPSARDVPDAPTPDTPTPGDSYVQSFARGLAVIRSFDAGAPQQTLSEVAQRTGLTRAGARRILLTLQTLGYVESDGRLFRLTARILDLGFAYLSSMPIWDLAEPLMQQLSATVGESSSAAVLDGNDIVYVLRVSTHKVMSISLGIGSRLPAYCTSLGRVLLADRPEDEQRRCLAASPLKAMTRRTRTSIDELMEELARVRRQGWSLVDQELEEGLISLSAPLVNRQGRVIAALNVSGQANRTSAAEMRRRILPALLETAQGVSKLLAASGR